MDPSWGMHLGNLWNKSLNLNVSAILGIGQILESLPFGLTNRREQVAINCPDASKMVVNSKGNPGPFQGNPGWWNPGWWNILSGKVQVGEIFFQGKSRLVKSRLVKSRYDTKFKEISGKSRFGRDHIACLQHLPARGPSFRPKTT